MQNLSSSMGKTYYSHTKNIRRTLPPGKELNIFVLVTDKEQTGIIRNIDFTTNPKKKAKFVEWGLYVQKQDGLKTVLEKIVDSRSGYNPEIDLFIEPTQEITLTAKNTDSEEVEARWTFEILQENFIAIPEAQAAKEGVQVVESSEKVKEEEVMSAPVHVPVEKDEVLKEGVPMPAGASYPVKEVKREEVRASSAGSGGSSGDDIGWTSGSARKSLLGGILRQSAAAGSPGSTAGSIPEENKPEKKKDEK